MSITSVTDSVTDFDIEAIRRDFPILNKPLPKGVPLVYLDNASSAQKPSAVVEREREVYENFYANAYRGVYRFGAQVDEEFEATREKVRQLIHAKSTDEIVFTSGTTSAINTVATGWGRKFLRPGDEILLSIIEHHANLVPWQQLAKQVGATCRFLPLTSDGQLDLGRLDEFLTARTRLVTMTAMSNVLGTMPPIREIARRAHDVGALVLIDAAQSVPHLPTDVLELGADFLTFSSHKIYGPSGVGVLYGRRELLESMDPLFFGGHMISRVTCESTTWADLPAKFEAGTPPIAQVIALGAAIDYVLQEKLGYPAIHRHESNLLNYAWKRLREVPGLRIHGPSPEHRGAILSFTIEGAHPEDLAQLLDRRGVFVRHGHHCTMPLHDWIGVAATVRASFGLYNTLSEVDALLDAIHFALQKLRVE
jgi:cysteine desulfurase/selenocysteine lyase